MTQPIQEPTPQRRDSALGFGQRQLQRRPAVGASTGDPECIDRFGVYSDPAQVVSGEQFDAFPNDQITGAIVGTAFSRDASDEIFIEEAGVYLLTASADWTASPMSSDQLTVEFTYTAVGSSYEFISRGINRFDNTAWVGVTFPNFDSPVHETSQLVVVEDPGTSFQVSVVVKNRNAGASDTEDDVVVHLGGVKLGCAESDPEPDEDRLAADRAIEYLWGGHKWNWMAVASNNMLLDFDNVTTDLSVDFGAYVHNGGGSNGSEMYVAAPLGPRWSVWGIDLCCGFGPDYGILKVELCTTPFFRRCQGTNDPDDGNTLHQFDIPSPVNTGSDYTFPAFTTISSWQLDLYNAVEDLTVYIEQLGVCVRLTGEHGDLLTDADTGLCEPVDGQSLDSGDGVMYWLRFYIDGKNASSTGYKAKIQAIRLSRHVDGAGLIV